MLQELITRYTKPRLEVSFSYNNRGDEINIYQAVYPEIALKRLCIRERLAVN
jgi:hypothetical protein